jgi:[acyl-carrier-protein] S-malonyltransferase
MERAKAAGARRVVPLAVSIAAHSALMEPVQAEFNQELQNTPFEAPEIPVIGNVSARPMRSVEQIRADLEAQLNHRVRWMESIQYLLESGVNTFVELGSGNVLTGLLRRIDRQARGLSLGQPEDFEALLSS